MTIISRKTASSSLAEAAHDALRRMFPHGVPVKRWSFRSHTDGAKIEATLLAEAGALVVLLKDARTGASLGERRYVVRPHVV
ncbi:MAG TPA: hypothetical protein PKA16_04200 [Ottowia sp.]|uniref:hypothetical protein n=1 Tax=Ottowia sp. TaxID=1898956 RepID=UPI002C84C5F9|nr:hypothetical protein [Ottowia sp.]HMN20577.1 hypothetical protein [Ottowia sp.]